LPGIFCHLLVQALNKDVKKIDSPSKIKKINVTLTHIFYPWKMKCMDRCILKIKIKDYKTEFGLFKVIISSKKLKILK
jgi:hypothetical protein